MHWKYSYHQYCQFTTQGHDGRDLHHRDDWHKCCRPLPWLTGITFHNTYRYIHSSHFPHRVCDIRGSVHPDDARNCLYWAGGQMGICARTSRNNSICPWPQPCHPAHVTLAWEPWHRPKQCLLTYSSLCLQIFYFTDTKLTKVSGCIATGFGSIRFTTWNFDGMKLLRIKKDTALSFLHSSG